MIPLVDLKKQYATIKDEIKKEFDEVLDKQSFILGDKVKQFEREFANIHESKYCLGCSSGTSALKLALRACGVGLGDEVITVPNTFIATIEPILELGAKPVFVDVRPDTYLMNTDLIKDKITSKTKAIIPVHLYGQMCEMDIIRSIADEHKLFVIEDAAQAHLAKYNGHYPGFYSDVACFSFFPGKNLGCYGDAGAVLTNDEDLRYKMLTSRDHGRKPGEKYKHDYFGTNERMDELQASVLLVKMRYIQNWTKQRKELAKKYLNFLDEKRFVLPYVNKFAEPVWHLFVVQLIDGNRDTYLEMLKNNGVGAGIHYPIPLHLQPALSCLGLIKGSFPIAEQLSEKIISLPLFPELDFNEVKEVL